MKKEPFMEKALSIAVLYGEDNWVDSNRASPARTVMESSERCKRTASMGNSNLC